MNAATEELLDILFPRTDQNKEAPIIGNDTPNELYLPDSLRHFFKENLQPMQVLGLFARAKMKANLQEGIVPPHVLLSNYIGSNYDWLDDGRVEPKEVLDRIAGLQTSTARFNYESLTKNLNSIVLIAHEDVIENKDALHAGTTDYAILKTLPLRCKVFEGAKIHPKVPYAQQPSCNSNYPAGTGFFIAERTVATAHHVLHEISSKAGADWREKLIIINGYYIDRSTRNQILIHKKHLFRLDSKQPSDETGDSDTGDWAFFNVKSVFDLPFYPASVDIAETATTCGANLYMLGHGLGLPVKISWDGHITQSRVETRNFEGRNIVTDLAYCKLESFNGNSGSPVFDALTHKVVGIMKGYNYDSGKSFEEIPENGEIYHMPVCYLYGNFGTKFTHIGVIKKRLLNAGLIS